MPKIDRTGRIDWSLTENNLRDLRQYYFPRGSGPLNMMFVICNLIDAIANEKGFDVGQTTNPLYPPNKPNRSQ